MTDNTPPTPIDPNDGDITGPGDAKPPKKPRQRPMPEGFRGHGRTSPQTEEQREAEERASQVWGALAERGGFDWKHSDWHPTEAERSMVRVLSFAGFSQEDIAFVGNMSVETLVKHFSYELRAATIYAIGDLTQRMYTRARDGDATLLMFALKTRGRGRFNDKVATAEALGAALVKEEPDAKKRLKVLQEIAEFINSKTKPKSKTKSKDGDDD